MISVYELPPGITSFVSTTSGITIGSGSLGLLRFLLNIILVNAVIIAITDDTIIGKKCIIAAQTGIAGCCNIEDEVILWGQSGIPSDVTIGKGVVVMAKSGVMSSIEPGKIVLGFIAKDHKTFLREYACIGKLPEIIRLLESKEQKDL